MVAFVSVDRSEASARLRTIASILTALGESFEQRAEEIEIKINKGRDTIVFRVTTCSIASVGFTSIAVFCDEVSRWESRDTAADPAPEVVSSLAPTMATQPAAFLVLSSSPWSIDDFHASEFAKGETAFQSVSYAPTWIANPSINEARTHELEPDDRVWRREYLAEPSASLCAAFEPDEVLACYGRMPRGQLRREGWIAIDPSSLRNDGFGFVMGTTTDLDEIVVMGAGEFGVAVPLREIVARLATAAHNINTRTIFSDQREEAALRVLFEEHGITLQTYAWSEKSKDESVSIVRRWMHERRLVVVAGEADGGPRLRGELHAVKARLLPSGRTQYSFNGLDIASSLLSFAHAVDAGDFELGSSNPLFDALERIAAERVAAEPVTGAGRATGIQGVDRDYLNMLAGRRASRSLIGTS